MEIRSRLWNWKKQLAISGAILGVISITLWFVKSTLIGVSVTVLAVALAINAYNIYLIIEGVLQSMKLGLKQAEISQKMKETQIQRLVELDESQRKHIDKHLKSYVDSASYKGVTSTAPNIVLRVKLFNLSVFQYKIVGWKLHFDMDDESQIYCMGKHCQLERQSDELNKEIGAGDSRKVDVKLNIPVKVAELIKDSSIEGKIVNFNMHIDWKSEIETIGEHTFRDYITFNGLPSLKT